MTEHNPALRKAISDALDEHMPNTKYGFANLLEKQTSAAIKEMKADLDKQLWGGAPPTNAAQYKYGTMKIPVTDEILKDLYMAPMRENIMTESTIMKYLQPKERKMSNESNIAIEAVRKRKEKRAKEVVEYVADFLEFTNFENGDIVTWTVVFPDSDKMYHYAALKGGSLWYITGDSYKFTTDDLVSKVTELALRGTVVFQDEPL